MDGYESRVWVCWPHEAISYPYSRPERCRGVSHRDCGVHDVWVPPTAYDKKRKS